jgi:hypothetical protein
MRVPTIALFGESERGEYGTAHLLSSVDELADKLGQPPAESVGLHLAIRTLLYHQQVIFLRVEEEGYSTEDYLIGLDVLRNKPLPLLNALCLPGVGDAEIIAAGTRICLLHRSLLLFSEADLYDYLTS